MPSKAIVGIVRRESGPSQPLRRDVGLPPEKRLVRAVRHLNKSG